jgi:hypothetical protein
MNIADNRTKQGDGMTALHRLVTVATLAVLACGDGTGLETEFSVQIDGPDALELSCNLVGEGSYTGTVGGGATNAIWSVNGDTTGLSNVPAGRFNYTFRVAGSYTIALEATSTDGRTARDEIVTVAHLPADLSSCLSVSKIRGHFAQLIRPGQQDVTSRYTVPRILEGSVDNLMWFIQRPGALGMDTILEGPDARTAEAIFADPGDHTLYLEATIDGVKDTLRKWIGVKEGEPIAEGTLMFFGQNRADSSGIYLMDLPTGFVEPILISYRLPGGQMACEPDGDRMVFPWLRGFGEVGEGAADLWMMNSEGEEQRLLTHEVGIEHYPSWSVHGVIAHTRDTRSNFVHDELYTMNLAGWNVIPLGGPEVNPSIAGFSTAWSPDGSTIALGDARHYVTPDSVEYRIKLISGDGRTVRLLHDRDLSEAYQPDPSDYMVTEGANGIAYSPTGGWIAYGAIVGPVGPDDLRIYRARTDGSGEIEELAVGFGPLVYTGDGEHLIFAAVSPTPDPNDFWGINIFMMPAAGGAAINLTAITADPPNEYIDIPGCWLPRKDY